MIGAAQGNLSLIPEKRSYTVELAGFKKASAEQICVEVDGQNVVAEVSYDEEKQVMLVRIPQMDVRKEICVKVSLELRQTENRVVQNC